MPGFQTTCDDGTRETCFLRCRVSVAAITITIFGLGLPALSTFADDQASAEPAAEVPAAVQAERDVIFTLMAYAVVYKDWQTEVDYTRGHNIGSVLVHLPTGTVVNWGRNCNKITNNGSNHGEVRLIRSFLQSTPNLMYLDDYCIYTTLEPCAMCSGMMCLTKVPRSVYGQTDPDYGKALERLALNSTAIGGYEPYPRLFKSELANTQFTKELNEQHAASGEGNITKWLRSDEALIIYRKATQTFLNYQVMHEDNTKVYHDAVNYYNAVVPAEYQPLPFDEAEQNTAKPKEQATVKP